MKKVNSQIRNTERRGRIGGRRLLGANSRPMSAAPPSASPAVEMRKKHLEIKAVTTSSSRLVLQLEIAVIAAEPPDLNWRKKNLVRAAS
jgi:hypothetical protein